MFPKIVLFATILAIVYGVTLKVTNSMGIGKTLYVKCASKEQSVGPKALEDGHDIQWDFDPKSNLNCLAEAAKDKNMFWQAYTCCDEAQTSFVVRDDGLYKGNLTGNKLEKVRDFRTCIFCRVPLPVKPGK